MASESFPLEELSLEPLPKRNRQYLPKAAPKPAAKRVPKPVPHLPAPQPESGSPHKTVPSKASPGNVVSPLPETSPALETPVERPLGDLSIPDNLAAAIASLSPEDQEKFIARLPYGATVRVREILTAYASEEAGSAVELLPHQRIPPPDQIKKGHLLAGGRGAGKSLAVAVYLARLAEATTGLRARVIAPTLSDAVNAIALDPQSGLLAHSPSARFVASGPEGVRVTWPNGATAYLVGTPTLKDVDRLRALTNIDIDVFEEAAANPQLAAAVVQADLSRRGTRLHHPIWVAASTPRPTVAFKAWLADPDVTVAHAGTRDNPYTPDTYRSYAESLRGTRMYRQEVLGEVLVDVEGALWAPADVDRSLIEDEHIRASLLQTISRCAVGVDPATGAGTVGIIVCGVTDPALDPAGFARLAVLDDFSVSDASPNTWGQRVISAFMAYGWLAPVVIAERNQGGRMVESTITAAAIASGIESPIPVMLAHSVVSKERRATPIALLWEVDPQRAVIAPPNGDVSRVTRLTDQMLEWIPGAYSPDRLDALTIAAMHLVSETQAPRGELQLPVPRRTVTPGGESSFRQLLRSGIGANMRRAAERARKGL